MTTRTTLRFSFVLATIFVAAIGISALRSEAAAGGRSCGHGVEACTASQVGQPCDPNNLNVVCSKQSNGRYCCLAYAP